MAVRVLGSVMPTPSPVSADQRVHIVLALLRKEDTLESLARKAGISPTSLSRWRDEFVDAGKSALGSGKVAQNQLSRQVDTLREELADRDQVIGELTMANRILKKNGRPDLTSEVRREVSAAVAAPTADGARFLRMTTIVGHLGWPASAWYRQALYGPRRAPGPAARGVAGDVVEIVVLAAHEWPWLGYKPEQRGWWLVAGGWWLGTA